MMWLGARALVAKICSDIAELIHVYGECRVSGLSYRRQGLDTGAI